MQDLYDPNQVERLIHSITDLQGQISQHGKQLQEAEHRSRFARGVALFAILVGLFATIVGAYAIYTSNDAHDAVEKVESFLEQQTIDRQQQLVSACIQFNAQRFEVRTAVKDALVALVPPGQPLTEAQQATAARYGAEVDEKLPYRDCSPAGLERYFKNPPVDPAVGK